MPTELKLKDIAQEYSSFRDNQVLTATQLNELIRYFDDQGRLTRTALLGVGIVCGLKISWDSSANTITASRGCGVTTDGDILSTSEALTFKLYKAYDDQFANYAPFWNGSEQIKLWELFTGEEDPTVNDTKSLDDFGEAADEPDLNDLAVIVYLESYAKTPDLCTALDCENQGERQVAQTRFLLIEKEELERIAANDSIYSKYQAAREDYEKLVEIPQPRVIMNGNNNLTGTNIALAYQSAVDKTRDRLWSAIENAYSDFKNWLDPETELVINDLKEEYYRIFPLPGLFRPLKLHFQYYFDLQKELVQAYHELRESLCELAVECLPDINAFPKHLMLAELSNVADPICRHAFYPSPIITQNDERILQARSQFRRINEMIRSFEIDGKSVDEIKATPSLDQPRPFGEACIPYYHNQSADLRLFWDFDRTKKGRQNRILSYNSPEYNNTPSVTTPLQYNIDPYDFFRIEGHIGRDYREVMEEMINYKKENGLSFDIVALKVGDGNASINIEDYDCQFEDFNAVFEAWKAEQNCLNAAISSFFSGFNLTQPGRHNNYVALVTEAGFTTAGPIAGFELGGTSGVRELGIGGGFGIGTSGVEVRGLGFELPLEQQISDSKSSALARYYLGNDFNTTYFRDTTVVDNLTVAEGTLGNDVRDILVQDDLISAADIKEGIQDIIGDITIGDLWNNDLRSITVNYPIDLIAKLTQVTRKMPKTIYDIDNSKIAELSKAIDDLCQAAEQVKRSASAIFKKESWQEQGYENQYIYFLNQMTINCCAAEKLEVLFEEIQVRKQKILDLISFPNYADKHPGVEHKAGVTKGGTFIIVYADKKTETPPTVSPGLVRPGIFNTRPGLFDIASIGTVDRLRIDSPSIEGLFRSGPAPGAAGKSKEIVTGLPPEKLGSSKDFVEHLAANHDRLDVDKEIGNFLKANDLSVTSPIGNLIRGDLSDLLSIRFRKQELNVAANTVIADFCLPYLCCSDCPPIAFMLPKQKVSLRLPVLFACRSDDANPIPFEVVPADGVVTADQTGEGLVTETNGRYFFNPAAVPDSLLDQEITFRVDDQVTDAKIIVYKKPQPAFSIGERQRFKNDTLEQVAFVNGTPVESDDNFTWEWDFGDGTLSNERTDRNPVHMYDLTKLREKEQEELTVRLTVTNGRCVHDIEETITFDLTVPDAPDPSACLEETFTRIQSDLEAFNQIFENDQNDEFKGFVEATIEFYQKIVDTGSDALSPDNTLDFITQIRELNFELSNLALQTEPPVGDILAFGITYQVRLALNLLRCQDELRIIANSELGSHLRAIGDNFNKIVSPYPIIKESTDMLEFLKGYGEALNPKREFLLSIVNKMFEVLDNS